ncbi:unnamed protein product, partial [Laminaria digitata]
AKLEQQLANTNREAHAANSAAARHDVAVIAAERAATSPQASRRPRSSRTSPARSSLPGPTDRRHSPPPPLLSLSPRSYRDVIAAPQVYTGQPVDSLFLDTLLVDFVHHIQHEFDVDTRRTVHERATSLLDIFEPYTGATLRFVFRHIDTSPVSEELTSAAHALVATLRDAHRSSQEPCRVARAVLLGRRRFLSTAPTRRPCVPPPWTP